jgi:hypothetical protein
MVYDKEEPIYFSSLLNEFEITKLLDSIALSRRMKSARYCPKQHILIESAYFEDFY